MKILPFLHALRYKVATVLATSAKLAIITPLFFMQLACRGLSKRWLPPSSYWS